MERKSTIFKKFNTQGHWDGLHHEVKNTYGGRWDLNELTVDSQMRLVVPYMRMIKTRDKLRNLKSKLKAARGDSTISIRRVLALRIRVAKLKTKDAIRSHIFEGTLVEALDHEEHLKDEGII